MSSTSSFVLHNDAFDRMIKSQPRIEDNILATVSERMRYRWPALPRDAGRRRRYRETRAGAGVPVAVHWICPAHHLCTFG